MNRRMPNGTYGGVRGRGCEAPAYSMGLPPFDAPGRAVLILIYGIQVTQRREFMSVPYEKLHFFREKIGVGREDWDNLKPYHRLFLRAKA